MLCAHSTMQWCSKSWLFFTCHKNVARPIFRRLFLVTRSFKMFNCRLTCFLSIFNFELVLLFYWRINKFSMLIRVRLGLGYIANVHLKNKSPTTCISHLANDWHFEPNYVLLGAHRMVGLNSTSFASRCA